MEDPDRSHFTFSNSWMVWGYPHGFYKRRFMLELIHAGFSTFGWFFFRVSFSQSNPLDFPDREGFRS